MDNHLRLERKLDSRLTQIDEKITNLNIKLERQDEAFFRLRENMVDKSKFHKLQDTLADVAGQADEKFIDIDSNFVEVRSALSYLKMENTRLNHRLLQVEELTSAQTIRAKKLNLTIEGLKEGGKKENLKTLVIDKVNAEAKPKTKLTKADILSAYRNGNLTKMQNIHALSPSLSKMTKCEILY